MHQLDDEEEKQPLDEIYTEQILEGEDEKKSRLSQDVRDYNKARNHFSKSTAGDDEFGVRDLERLLEGGNTAKKSTAHNNRSSSLFGSLN